MIPVMVIVIVPELWRLTAVELPAGSIRVGGFSILVMPADPGEEAAVIKNRKIARSEAKHRKRSVFMSVPIIPQAPLDNHNPHMISFLG